MPHSKDRPAHKAGGDYTAFEPHKVVDSAAARADQLVRSYAQRTRSSTAYSQYVNKLSQVSSAIDEILPKVPEEGLTGKSKRVVEDVIEQVAERLSALREAIQGPPVNIDDELWKMIHDE